MKRHHLKNGKQIAFTQAEEEEADARDAAHAAAAPSRARQRDNAVLQKQIINKERRADRSLRELMRERHFPGDLTSEQIDFAKNRMRQLDQEIEALRAQII